MKTIITLIFSLIFLSNVKGQNVERYMEYHDKGRMFILEGKYKKAIQYLDTAISIMPYYTTIFQDRGYAYMQLKEYNKAVMDFNHVLNKKPFMNEAKLQRGMALYHLNRLNEAEYDLIEVMNSNPAKSREVSIYLDNIAYEKEIQAQQELQKIEEMRWLVESERLRRARHREEVIWNTVVPLAFWTTVFLTW